MLGPDPSVDKLAATVVPRVGGNPFFAEEMVRELAQRGVLDGERGGYVCQADVTEVSVPGTVQATIGARIDRLDPAAKRTLNAAAVIGLRFGSDLLAQLEVEPALDDLLRAELIYQMRFTPTAEYAFHHPLIRAVAYESQLKSDRSEWHRRLAATIQTSDPESVDERAALVAEHLEAAGEVREAYRWHMRAGGWSTRRDIAAARASWERARQIADSLPDSEPNLTAMRIAPRTKLCGSAWRGVHADVPRLVQELRELCTRVGDNASLAIGLTALSLQHGFHGRMRDASQLASEQMALLKTVGDPTSTIGAATAAASVFNETGHSAETLSWAQSVIEWAGGESIKQNSQISPSPLIALALVFRVIARWRLGHGGWREDLEDAVAMARTADPITHPAVVSWAYLDSIPHGVLRVDDTVLRELEGALRIAVSGPLSHDGDTGGPMAEPRMARRAGGAGAGWVLVDSQFDRHLAVATNPGGIHAVACTDRDGDRDACPGPGASADASAGADRGGAAGVAQHFSVTLGQHQLHDVRLRRRDRRPL